MGANEDRKEDEAAKTTAHKVDRSPNYPAITFTEALERAKKIWDAEKRHPVSQEIAAQHMGYKKLTGSSYPVLGALKRYGLLGKAGKDVRITDDAHFVFVHPEGSQERDEVIRRLVMLPDLFGQVLAKFPEGLPSDVNLRAQLQTTWDFASASAADTFIKSLREAVRIRDSGVAKSDPSVKDIGGPAKETTVTHDVIPPMKPPLTNQERGSGAPPPPGGVSRRWEIADGRFASVGLPAEPTVGDVEALEEFLAILKQELALVWKKKVTAKKGGDQ